MSTKLTPERIALRIEDLPPIPSSVADVLRIANDPCSSSADAELIVGRDAALTAKVLRVTNSAAYGFRRRVESVREAVAMLGMRTLRDTSAAMAAAALFGREDGSILDVKRLWTHSLASSLWTRQILQKGGFWDIDITITAALLHDFGILVLARHYPEAYAETLHVAQTEGLPHHVAEQRILGTSHARVAAALCAKWNLPVSITQLISHHHSSACPAEPALAVLMLADRLAEMCNESPFDWDAPRALPAGLLALLGLDRSAVRELIGMRASIMHQMAAFREAAGL
jgi:HD-like signal output (HDOD) protein